MVHKNMSKNKELELRVNNFLEEFKQLLIKHNFTGLTAILGDVIGRSGILHCSVSPAILFNGEDGEPKQYDLWRYYHRDYNLDMKILSDKTKEGFNLDLKSELFPNE